MAATLALSRNEGTLSAPAASLPDVSPFDMLDTDAAVAAVAAIADRHGRLDILISNAGSIVRKPLVEQSEADWRDVIDADLTAGWRLAREAAPIMAQAGYGRMIFVSSIMASSRAQA